MYSPDPIHAAYPQKRVKDGGSVDSLVVERRRPLVPRILACPPSSGSALVDDSTDTLELAGLGSGEHGCDALGLDVLSITVTPTAVPASNSIDFTITIDGVPYLALPSSGTIGVTHASGHAFLSASAQAAGGLTDEFTSADGEEVSRITLTSGVTQVLSVTSSDPPYTQVQGDWFSDGGSPPTEGGFVELDWDHGCEETYGMTSLTLEITLRLAYAP